MMRGKNVIRFSLRATFFVMARACIACLQSDAKLDFAGKVVAAVLFYCQSTVA